MGNVGTGESGVAELGEKGASKMSCIAGGDCRGEVGMEAEERRRRKGKAGMR